MDAEKLAQEIAAEEEAIARYIHNADCEVAFRRGRLSVRRELLAQMQAAEAEVEVEVEVEAE